MTSTKDRYVIFIFIFFLLFFFLENMIKGLDDDEVEFLDLVDRTKMEEERKKNLEEEKEMRDFKAAVASLQEKSLDERLKQELKQPQINHKTTSWYSFKPYNIIN